MEVSVALLRGTPNGADAPDCRLIRGSFGSADRSASSNSAAVHRDAAVPGNSACHLSSVSVAVVTVASRKILRVDNQGTKILTRADTGVDHRYPNGAAIPAGLPGGSRICRWRCVIELRAQLLIHRDVNNAGIVC